MPPPFPFAESVLLPEGVAAESAGWRGDAAGMAEGASPAACRPDEVGIPVHSTLARGPYCRREPSRGIGHCLRLTESSGLGLLSRNRSLTIYAQPSNGQKIRAYFNVGLESAGGTEDAATLARVVCALVAAAGAAVANDVAAAGASVIMQRLSSVGYNRSRIRVRVGADGQCSGGSRGTRSRRGLMVDGLTHRAAERQLTSWPSRRR